MIDWNKETKLSKLTWTHLKQNHQEGKTGLKQDLTTLINNRYNDEFYGSYRVQFKYWLMIFYFSRQPLCLQPHDVPTKLLS